MNRQGPSYGLLAVLVVAALCVVAAVRLSAHDLPSYDAVDDRLSLDECDEGAGEDVPPCRDVLRAHVEALEPGEVLRIAPGTYDIGTVIVDGLEGTPEERIEITAEDPGQAPHLVGHLRLVSADQVTLSHLTLVASEDDLPALAMQCGVGWEVTRSVVRGAADSGAMSNLNISGSQPDGPTEGGPVCPDEPRDFSVSSNCFRDPYTDPELEDHPDPEVRATRGFYHQIYASFEGGAGTGGRIERNVLQGHTNGAGIKLGNGAHHTLGPWHVDVTGNAFIDGRSAVILHDDVRDNTIEDNLVIDVAGSTNAGDDVVFYAARLGEPTNVVSGTRAYGAGTMFGIGPDESAELVDGGGNVIVDESTEPLDRDLPTGLGGCVAHDALPWPD